MLRVTVLLKYALTRFLSSLYQDHSGQNSFSNGMYPIVRRGRGEGRGEGRGREDHASLKITSGAERVR